MDTLPPTGMPISIQPPFETTLFFVKHSRKFQRFSKCVHSLKGLSFHQYFFRHTQGTLWTFKK